MDSGNSGSMQSSSGGEQEYDSRSESISSFLNNRSGHFGSISNPQAPPLLAHQPTLFNPHSQNLDAFQQSLANPSGNTQFSNDLVWSRGLRSEANYGNFGNVTGLSSSSSSSSSQSILGVQGLNQSPFPNSSSSMPSQTIDANAALASLQSDQPNIVKNPKKRTRASRRAPTTVLTTDTTNFRQMVQEFTGIPTAPFSGSPYSRRLDLFSTGSSSIGPLYPLRPSAQKVQIPSFAASNSSPLLNSNMIDALVSSTNPAAAGSSHNTVLPSDHLDGLQKQPHQNLLNMQNQMLSFQPLLQSSSLHPSLKHPSSILTAKSQGNSSVPTFDELGLGPHENANANLSGFSAALNGGAGHQENLGGTSSTFDGNRVNNSQQHLNAYKFNCSASTSEFHPDKGLENVSSGGEGTVGSWICPSD